MEKVILQQTFEGENLGVCIKDSNGKVLQQNDLCLKICGNCLGKVCTVACMDLYAKDKSQQWQDWGSRVYNNSFAHDAYYDITMLCSEESLITFLQPLKHKHKAAVDYYKKLGLTKRETEIIRYVIKGASNTDICQRLSVSKATLKTHLNNIYKKINDKGVELKFIPHKRLSNANTQSTPL